MVHGLYRPWMRPRPTFFNRTVIVNQQAPHCHHGGNGGFWGGFLGGFLGGGLFGAGGIFSGLFGGMNSMNTYNNFGMFGGMPIMYSNCSNLYGYLNQNAGNAPAAQNENSDVKTLEKHFGNDYIISERNGQFIATAKDGNGEPLVADNFNDMLSLLGGKPEVSDRARREAEEIEQQKNGNNSDGTEDIGDLGDDAGNDPAEITNTQNNNTANNTSSTTGSTPATVTTQQTGTTAQTESVILPESEVDPNSERKWEVSESPGWFSGDAYLKGADNVTYKLVCDDGDNLNFSKLQVTNGKITTDYTSHKITSIQNPKTKESLPVELEANTNRFLVLINDNEKVYLEEFLNNPEKYALDKYEKPEVKPDISPKPASGGWSGII